MLALKLASFLKIGNGLYEARAVKTDETERCTSYKASSCKVGIKKKEEVV